MYNSFRISNFIYINAFTFIKYRISDRLVVNATERSKTLSISLYFVLNSKIDS